jgi:hypothetical protein
MSHRLDQYAVVMGEGMAGLSVALRPVSTKSPSWNVTPFRLQPPRAPANREVCTRVASRSVDCRH